MAIHTTFMERRSCSYLALIRPAESTIRETTVGAGLAWRGRREEKITPIIRILLVSLATIACLVGSPAPASALGPAGSGAATVPELDWHSCPNPTQRGFECATAQVPMDYGDPRGATIDLAVIRHPATDPVNRVGTLFFNPGGPGLGGTRFLPTWFDFFPATLRARFDIISWDPRGVGASTPVRCFATPEDEIQFFAELPDGFPVDRAEQVDWISGYAQFGDRCGMHNGDLLAHVSTTDNAMDLDLLRQAVGDAQLDFLGISYGSFLGAIYANLYPEKAHAMVLDGNVNPVAWTTGGDHHVSLSTILRLGSDKGAAATLDAFLTLCGQAPAQCAFSAGSARATKAKWTILLQRLRERPVTIESPVPGTFTYAALVQYVGGASTHLVFAQLWPNVAELLQSLWNASLEAAAQEPPQSALPVSGPVPLIRDAIFPEQLIAVLCGESPNPREPQAYPRLAALARARSGNVGPAWIWESDEPCATWPATAVNRYVGPWNRPTANPVLVIGQIFDPETPYEGAVAMAHELARARLLTVAGYGHTTFLQNPSTCAYDYVSSYFIDGTLPPERTICRPDTVPFTTSSSPASDEAMNMP